MYYKQERRGLYNKSKRRGVPAKRWRSQMDGERAREALLVVTRTQYALPGYQGSARGDRAKVYLCKPQVGYLHMYVHMYPGTDINRVQNVMMNQCILYSLILS